MKVYVIVRGRIKNNSTMNFINVCIMVTLQSEDDRIGGQSATCAQLGNVGANQSKTFESRIDNPVYGNWDIRFSLSNY